MKYGIIGALESEVTRLKEKLENVKTIELSGFTFWTGTFSGIEIVLLKCSIGKVNSALGCSLMISLFHVDKVINTGIAGALDNRLKPLDLVLSEEITYHDFPLNLLKKYFPFTEKFSADKKLLEIAKKERPDAYCGLIVTGDEFVDNFKRKQEITKRFPNALCLEMEGASIAHTCYINHIDFLIVRCISDLADEKTDINYEEFESRAAEISLSFVEKIIINDVN